jgi:tetratricopeptide (TPR) repeat protein
MMRIYQMYETTRKETAENKQIDSPSMRSKLLSLITNIRAQYRGQSLDAISNRLYAILKIVIFLLLLLAMALIFIKIYTPQGVVVMPFEISKNENLSGIAIADQLTYELSRIQQIHNVNNEEIVLRTSSIYSKAAFSAEQSLGRREMVIPKSKTMEFSMADTGTIDIGSNSLSLGKLIIAFKNICPGSEPVTIIRGSLQRYGSNIFLVAVLEGGNVQSWMARQPIESNNGEQLHEMIRNLSFMIAHDLPQSNVSAKTWEGLKYYTEALDAYNKYELSGNPEDLSLAGNYSLEAISSEKGYNEPFNLLLSLELAYIMIVRQNNAIEYCNKTIELDPASTRSWTTKGEVLNCLDKYDEAIKACNEAISKDPKYAAAWNNKGFALGYLEKYDEAIKAFDEAIRLDPNYADAWANKGFILNRQGKYDKAIKAFDEAIRLDPKDAGAWGNKGAALYSLGRNAEADAAFAKAKELEKG